MDRVRHHARRLVAAGRDVFDLAREDDLTLVAAGVAFYAFLALVPAIVAATTVYGLVAEPAEIERQVRSFAGAVPRSTQDFLIAQLRSGSDQAGQGIAAVVAVVLAFWSASAGTAALLRGLAVINGSSDVRSSTRRRGVALLVTAGAVLVVALSVWLVTVLPPQLDALGTLPDALRSVIAILRWPLLAAVLTASIRGLYSISAGYSATRPVTAGALAATLVWLAGSALFGVYTSNFSVLTERYGSISSIVVVLLWLYLGAFATLLGAEVDAVTVAHRTSSDEVQPEPLRSDPLVSERRRRGTTAQVPRH